MGSVSAKGRKWNIFPHVSHTGQTELQENSLVTELSLEINALGSEMARILENLILLLEYGDLALQIWVTI